MMMKEVEKKEMDDEINRRDDLESEEQLTVDLLLRVLLSTVNSCSTFQSCG